MLPRSELRGPVADGQFASQLHRWFRRARLSDVLEHCEDTTAEEADHTATHQDDSQVADQTIRRAAAGSRGTTAHKRCTLGAGRFRCDPATRVTNLNSDSNSAPDQQPRAVQYSK